ncbi:MAG: MFS family permease [Candidatus Midichloriaceae bacterium]|jgi:MFS family permease
MTINYNSFKTIFLSIGLLLVSTALLISGSGFINTLISLKLKMDGYSSLVIGVISSMYFLGMLVGSLKISLLINIVGYVKSFSTLSAVMAISILFPGMYENLYALSVCRFIQGVCIAGLYVIVESWVLCSSSDNTRGKNLATYMIVLYGSYSLSQFLLSADHMNTIIPFCIASMLVISSIIPLSSFPVTPPMLEEHQHIKIMRIYRASPSGFVGCFISGLFIAAIFTIFPLYVEEVVHSTYQVSVLLSITFLSGVLMQYPLGWLSDKMDRQTLQILLNICYTALLILFAFLEIKGMVNFNILIFIAIGIGMFSFTIYPISMNLVCDNLKRSEIVRGTEVLTIAFGMGSILGPIYTTFSIKIFGFSGYSIAYASLTILLTMFSLILYRKTQREKHIPISETITPFIPHTNIDTSNINIK